MLRWQDKFKLAANVRWLFTEADSESRLSLASQAGFAGVEIPDPYTTPPADLARTADRGGLKVIVINTPAGPLGSDSQWGSACLPDRVDEFREGVRRAIEYAVQLRSGFVHVMGGQVPPELKPAAARAIYLENIAWASSEASAAGVRVLIEVLNRVDVPRFALRSLSDAMDCLKEIDDRNLGLLFDVYHCQMNAESPERWLREASDVIRHVQVADVPGRHEPGTGSISWSAVFDALLETDYQGWVGCEYRPRHQTLASLGWIQETTTTERLPLLDPVALTPPQAALHAKITGGPRAADRARSPITDRGGRLLGPFSAMIVNPAIGDPMQALGAAIRYSTSLRDDHREIATLLVAAELDSPFEWLAHERLARAAGVSESTLVAIATGNEPEGLDHETATVYGSTRSLLASGDLNDAEYEGTRRVLGTTGTVELVSLVGYYRMLALLLRTFRVQTPAA